MGVYCAVFIDFETAFDRVVKMHCGINYKCKVSFDMSKRLQSIKACVKTKTGLKLLRQGYRCHKLRKAFSKFHRRHFDIVSKYNVGLKTVLLQEPAFYGDLVYKF